MNSNFFQVGVNKAFQTFLGLGFDTCLSLFHNTQQFNFLVWKCIKYFSTDETCIGSSVQSKWKPSLHRYFLFLNPCIEVIGTQKFCSMTVAQSKPQLEKEFAWYYKSVISKWDGSSKNHLICVHTWHKGHFCSISKGLLLI